MSEDSEDSSSEIEFKVKKIIQKSPKKARNEIVELEIEEAEIDKPEIVTFDAETAEFLSKDDQFRPNLVIRDCYKYDETCYDLPPKPEKIEYPEEISENPEEKNPKEISKKEFLNRISSPQHQSSPVYSIKKEIQAIFQDDENEQKMTKIESEDVICLD